jgi:hypothetical protein
MKASNDGVIGYGWCNWAAINGEEQGISGPQAIETGRRILAKQRLSEIRVVSGLQVVPYCTKWVIATDQINA